MDAAGLSLAETPDGLQITYDGRSLYGERPVSGAVRKARALQPQNSTLYLLTSPCAWHGVPELLASLPASSSVLAVEADPVLLELSRRLLTPELRDAGLLPVPPDLDQELPVNVTSFRRVVEISLSRGSSLNRLAYRAFSEAVTQRIRVHWQNTITLSAMARLWASNIFRNLPALASSAPPPGQDASTRSRLPAVVCGAGPSLSASLALIAELRESILLVCVDTALPVLASRGIVPDYVLALEAQFANLYDFLPVSDRSYTLVADITSCPAVVGLHDPARTSWVASEFADLALLHRVRTAGLPVLTIPALGSVGVSAVHLAFGLTTGPLFLTGLDFAMTVDSAVQGHHQTHAPGTPSSIARLLRDARLTRGAPADLGDGWITREGVTGTEVLTTLALLGYSEQLRSVLSAHASQSAFVIEPFGLETGGEPVSVDEAAKVIRKAAKHHSGRGSADDVNGQSGQTPAALVAGFLENEAALLDGLAAHLRTEYKSGNPDPRALKEAFAPCDYVAADFADFDGTLRTDPGFLTRVRVSVDYYLERVQRALRLRRS